MHDPLDVVLTHYSISCSFFVRVFSTLQMETYTRATLLMGYSKAKGGIALKAAFMRGGGKAGGIITTDS
jgi:hypothetical protein